VVGDKSFDLWKCFYKGGGHFFPLELAGTQHKSPYFRRRNCRSFSDTVTDAIILGEHDPAALADFCKPIFVFSVRSKMIVVNLDDLADFPQRLGDDLPTERTVNKKD